MSERWVIRLPEKHWQALAPFRIHPGLSILVHDDVLWVQGTTWDEKLDQQLRAIPHAERFFVLPDSQLMPMDQHVPSGHLPQGEWTPLQQWISIQLEPPALSGTLEHRVAVKLVRSSVAKSSNLLLTSLQAWHDYAITAPQLRLDQWSFAVNEQAQVLVWGAPCPPIRGQHFVEEQRIAVPVGWTWSPSVEVTILRKVLQVGADDLALLATDASWNRIAVDDFVRASRSAVRLSQERMTSDA